MRWFRKLVQGWVAGLSIGPALSRPVDDRVPEYDTENFLVPLGDYSASLTSGLREPYSGPGLRLDEKFVWSGKLVHRRGWSENFLVSRDLHRELENFVRSREE